MVIGTPRPNGRLGAISLASRVARNLVVSLLRLEPVRVAELEAMAKGLAPSFKPLAMAPGSWPPAHVAQRTLVALSMGCEERWAVPYHIVWPERAIVVGGCGFKGVPIDGEVEVGYGIAPEFWRQGYGGWALSELLHLAQGAGEIRSVLASIAPGNIASCALASKLGFFRGVEFIDADGERLHSWHWPCETRKFC